MTLSRVLLTTIFLLMTFAPHAETINGVEYERIATFDAKNFIMEPKDEGVRKKLPRKISRDGVITDFNLDRALKKENVASGVSPKITYADKNRIWVISVLGRLVGEVYLFNLQENQLEKFFYGIPRIFYLSPDRLHVAYAEHSMTKNVKHYNQVAIFVDSTMVYPVIEGGFTKRYEFGQDKPNGTSIGRWMPKDLALGPLSPIHWLDNATIEFVIATAPADGGEDVHKTWFRVRVEGLATPDVNPKRIRKTESRISEKDAMACIDEILRKVKDH